MDPTSGRAVPIDIPTVLPSDAFMSRDGSAVVAASLPSQPKVISPRMPPKPRYPLHVRCRRGALEPRWEMHVPRYGQV